MFKTIQFVPSTAMLSAEKFDEFKPFVLEESKAGVFKLINKQTDQIILSFDFKSKEIKASQICKTVKPDANIFEESIGERLNKIAQDQMGRYAWKRYERQNISFLNPKNFKLVCSNHFTDLYSCDEDDFFESNRKNAKKFNLHIKKQEPLTPLNFEPDKFPKDLIRLSDIEGKSFKQLDSIFQYMKNVDLGILKAFRLFRVKFELVLDELDWNFKQLKSEKVKFIFKSHSKKSPVIHKLPESDFVLPRETTIINHSKFLEKKKWFGFRDNDSLRKLLSVTGDIQVYARYKNLTDLLNYRDISNVYTALLNLCELTKSKQFVSFCRNLKFQGFEIETKDVLFKRMVLTLAPIDNLGELWIDISKKISNVLRAKFVPMLLNSFLNNVN